VSSESKLVELQQTLYTSRNATRRWLHCSRRDWIIDALLRAGLEGPTTRAVEVGPGSGVYLPTLTQLYREVVAIDIEKDYLEHVRYLSNKHDNLTLMVDDITASRLPSASADLILCTEVVEHIGNSASAIREMRRILHPGGVLVMSTPQRYSPLELAAKIAFLPGVIELVRLIYREPILATGHINLMTAGQVRRQLARAGFQIQQTHKSGTYLPLFAELGGHTALRFEQWLESKLCNTALDGFLWTQYYVALA